MRRAFPILLITTLACRQPAPAPPPAPTAIPPPVVVATPVPPQAAQALPVPVVPCKAVGMGSGGVVWQGDCVDLYGASSCRLVRGTEKNGLERKMWLGECKSPVGLTINRFNKRIM